MLNFSIWNFNKFSNLEDFVKTINDNKLETRNSGKAYGNLNLKNEIKAIENYEFNSVREIDVYKNKVRYVIFEVNVQGCTKDAETDLYVVQDRIEKVIAFEKNNVVKVVICASREIARRIIDKMYYNNELIWGYIDEDAYVNEDVLYWLFYRLRELPNEKIVSNPDMYLNGIVSYLGRTNDKINAVRGRGIRVSALLGTLGMLLGEESLRALRPVIQYNNHEIEVELCVGNTGKLYQKSYCGPIEIDDNIECEIKLILLVCKYILPSLKKGYDDDNEDNRWSPYIKQTFLRGIGNEMADKVANEITRIERELKKYSEEDEILNDFNFDKDDMDGELSDDELDEE